MAVKRDIGSRLAYAGIGAAISLIFVVAAYYVKFLTLSFYVLSSAGIMLPITKKYFREGALTAVVVSVAGFFIVNLSIIPFVMASGLYVVATLFLYEKNFNRWIGYVIKFFYAGLVFFLCYKIVGLITIDFNKLPALGDMPAAGLYAVLNLIFSALFLAYDFLVEKGYEYLSKLTEKIGRSK